MTIIWFLFFAEPVVPTVSGGKDESSGVDSPITEPASSSGDRTHVLQSIVSAVQPDVLPLHQSLPLHQPERSSVK